MTTLIEEQYQAALAQRQQWDREDRLAARLAAPAPAVISGPCCDECGCRFQRPAGERCPRRYVDGCVGVLR